MFSCVVLSARLAIWTFSKLRAKIVRFGNLAIFGHFLMLKKVILEACYAKIKLFGNMVI
jgi:hypothetical protein